MPPMPGSPRGEGDSPVPTSHSSQCSHCWAAPGKGVLTRTWLELTQQHSPGNLPAPPHCLGVGPRTCQGTARELTQGGGMRGIEKPFTPTKRGDGAALIALIAHCGSVAGAFLSHRLMKPQVSGSHQEKAKAPPLSLSPPAPTKTSRCASLGFQPPRLQLIQALQVSLS